MLRRSLLLAWLVAILGILVPSIASAATTANLETRVKAFELVAPTLIGRSTARTTEKHPEKSNAYDEIASGSPLAAEGTVARGGAAAAEDGFTTLFRTVSEGEQASIQSAGRYTPAAGGVEGKYFYPTAEQAGNLAKANFPSQGVQTLTSVRVPNSVVGGATRLHVAGEGPVYFFNGQQLQQLGAPSIWPYFPLP